MGREIETYGFHHWLELEKYFEMLMNFNQIDESHVYSNSVQNDKKIN